MQPIPVLSPKSSAISRGKHNAFMLYYTHTAIVSDVIQCDPCDPTQPSPARYCVSRHRHPKRAEKKSQ